MYRRSMADDRGMLFQLDGRRDHTFWMHNTCIPLDMMFVDDDGVIVGIVEGAAPLTDTTRSVGCPSSFVLEVNGGWTRKHGVKPGQKLTLPPRRADSDREIIDARPSIDGADRSPSVSGGHVVTHVMRRACSIARSSSTLSFSTACKTAPAEPEPPPKKEPSPSTTTNAAATRRRERRRVRARHREGRPIR